VAASRRSSPWSSTGTSVTEPSPRHTARSPTFGSTWPTRPGTFPSCASSHWALTGSLENQGRARPTSRQRGEEADVRLGSVLRPPGGQLVGVDAAPEATAPSRPGSVPPWGGPSQAGARARPNVVPRPPRQALGAGAEAPVGRQRSDLGGAGIGRPAGVGLAGLELTRDLRPYWERLGRVRRDLERLRSERWCCRGDPEHGSA